MKKWRGLKPGAKISLIAPGFKMNNQTQVIQLAEQMIMDWGYTPVCDWAHHSPDTMYSASLDVRRESLLQSLRNPEVQVIWCLRGGYGSLQLIGALPKMMKDKKLLIGFSDATTLHQALWQKYQWVGLMGPHLDSIVQDPPESEGRRVWMQKFLAGKIEVFASNQPLIPLNSQADDLKKNLKGRVFGGNLTTWQSGYLSRLQTNKREPGHLLVFEDWGERGYRVDRLLTSLEWAGAFRNTAGIIFGEFLYGDEPNEKISYVENVLTEFAQRLKIPVWRGFPHGHGAKGMTPWLHGATLQVEKNHHWVQRVSL